MGRWIKFRMKEEIKDFPIENPKGGGARHRNRGVCERCGHYIIRSGGNGVSSEICLAMPPMLEGVAALKIGNEEMVPFEERRVPANCEFYVEQLMSEINNDAQ